MEEHPARHDVSAQLAYLAQLEALLQQEADVAAAWLEGSFGRGNADRYADIDLHVLVAPSKIAPANESTIQNEADDLAALRTKLGDQFATVRPLVLARWLFDGRMFNGLSADGLRLDLWLHTQTPTLQRHKVRILFDRDGSLQLEDVATAPDATNSDATNVVDTVDTATRLTEQMAGFWRCIALLPAVIGRGELIVAVTGLSIESNILTDVIILGDGIERDSGVKRLNPFLPADQRHEIESALALDGLTPQSLVNAHMGLAQIMQREGRALAERHGCTYPAEIETAALAYVARELGPLGLMKKQDTNGSVKL